MEITTAKFKTSWGEYTLDVYFDNWEGEAVIKSIELEEDTTNLLGIIDDDALAKCEKAARDHILEMKLYATDNLADALMAANGR